MCSLDTKKDCREVTMSIDPCFYCGEYFEAVFSIESVCRDCEKQYCKDCDAIECECEL